MKYFELHKAIISFLKQKVKQECKYSGDLDSRCFHACLKKRRFQNQVCRNKDVNGLWQEEREKIEMAFFEFYKQLLGIAPPVEGHVSNIILKKIYLILNSNNCYVLSLVEKMLNKHFGTLM